MLPAQFTRSGNARRTGKRPTLLLDLNARFPGQSGVLQSRVPRNRIGPCHELSIHYFVLFLSFLFHSLVHVVVRFISFYFFALLLF